MRISMLAPCEPNALCDLIAAASSLERNGLDVLWVGEPYGFDAPTTLAFFAARTTRVQLGTGILPVYSRTPTLTAMTAAGLDSGVGFSTGSTPHSVKGLARDVLAFIDVLGLTEIDLSGFPLGAFVAQETVQLTLVANGGNDILVPTVNSYLLAGHIPDARLIIYRTPATTSCSSARTSSRPRSASSSVLPEIQMTSWFGRRAVFRVSTQNQALKTAGSRKTHYIYSPRPEVRHVFTPAPVPPG